LQEPCSPILLFDGVCNLCNTIVNIVLKFDRKKVFRFSAMQSTGGKAQLQRFGLHADKIPTVVLIEGDTYFIKSTAAFRIMQKLPWPYRALYLLIWIPKPIRDFGYDLIANNRYRFLGKRKTCRMPTAELEARFLA
jgi:predicted DCC family thiol-disulfide oxidoreductase YuxK